jgi:hypothetical protein
MLIKVKLWRSHDLFTFRLFDPKCTSIFEFKCSRDHQNQQLIVIRYSRTERLG